ncbi:hypothetical protein P4O66_003198 [Electrophorus voltai]|uniref:Reverse transcriptase/retrotransposon-derived protein RNase H-like domain-containing protein n=1 Tax=Electrophorus voltai TaxID=2609070 RepID=A0AAD9DM24_9TELE|nr:hypothetical protein P4O66_003198 [Electrophorus voltai]
MPWGMSETRLQAFVDSGAAGNFLDTGFALPLVPLDEPLPIAAIDGRSLEPGVVSYQTCPDTLRVSAHTEHIVLFIIHAPDLQLILGYPWLQRHNPQAPILQLPDAELLFVIEVDASEVGVGAVLSQQSREDKKLHPCAYFSRCLSPAEQNYDMGNCELLAVKLVLEEWRH